MIIIYFILVFGSIILIHELGHLLAAKAFNVYCDEFAFGMGPKLISKKFNETTYSVRLLPIGGFVAMAGEADAGFDQSDIPIQRTIKGIAKWKQVIIMLAGVFMNFVLALVLFVSINLINPTIQLPATPVISEVQSGSPADIGGFLADDEIIQVIYPSNDVVIPESFSDVGMYFQLFPEQEINFIVNRDGQEVSLFVTPKLDEASGRYLVGISGKAGELKHLTRFEAITQGFKDLKASSGLILEGFKFLFKGIGLNQISGPIGIIDQTNQIMTQAQSFQHSVLILMVLIATFSVNLGIMNLLPLPMLDGGRVLILMIEKIFKRSLSKNIENALMFGSFLVIVALMVFTVFNDISRIIFR